MKRDLESTPAASGDDSAESGPDAAVKWPRISSPPPSLSFPSSFGLKRPEAALVRASQAHPMVVLEAIRTKLQRTVDPHLQARLLLQYSAIAASPDAPTTVAIDFLFSFLQQHQSQSTSLNEGNQSKDATSSGPIVVGAIVRGLRQLLAVKAAVVEPMIQVDAMGEQLMQCMSVGDDCKLRRDMLRIVVDCLLCTKKFAQLKLLLHTSVQDHDASMQAICLQAYRRLYDRGQGFAVETVARDDAAVEQFDRFTSLVLFAPSTEVRVLAAQVIVALTELYPQSEAKHSRYFPSSTATKVPLFLPEKIFYVLCMAATDASQAVRAEVARCLRRMPRVLASEVVEHALVKTQIDDAVNEEERETVEMKTRCMMSSGVLLSLLEDVDDEVAAEASRTIARLSEVATVPGRQWSQRVVERTITAHFDVLARASRSSISLLRPVFVKSLGRLLVCRRSLGSDLTISSADLSSLLRSDSDTLLSTAVETLHVLQDCDLSSTWAVQRLVDYIVKTATSSERLPADSDDNDHTRVDCWKQHYLCAVRDLGTKCCKELRADVALLDRLKLETLPLNGRGHFVKSVCQALLGHLDLSTEENPENSPLSPVDGSSLFFLQSPSACSRTFDRSSVIESMDALRLPPVGHNFVVYLKAIHRLRTAFATEESFQLVDCLVRLRQHLRSFPEAITTPPPPPLKYVPMSAMLSTSPSVSSERSHSASVNCRTECEAEAFASLQLPIDLQKSCQAMIDVASGVYVKAFALSSLPRTELLQLILLGRVGLELASLQESTDSRQRIEKLRWLAKEATKLDFLGKDSELKDGVWISPELLADVSSLNDLKRAFVVIVRKAWPTALIKAAIARYTPAISGSCVTYRRLSTAHASITEPVSIVRAKSEPREITANRPFEQRIQFFLTNTRDLTQVYIKSMLPNGDVAYHHVPLNCIRTQGPRRHSVVHTIMLTISPFSDPTAFSVAVHLGHPILPGLKPSASDYGNTPSRMFTEISAPVRVLISPRTSSTLRHAAARSSTAGGS